MSTEDAERRLLEIAEALKIAWITQDSKRGDRWIFDHLEKFSAAYLARRRRMKTEELPPSATLQDLVLAFEMNEIDAAAFLQALASALTPDILVMVWMILKGADIHQLQSSYSHLKSFRIEVAISLADEHDCPTLENTTDPRVFRTDVVWDLAVLRHIGMFTVNERPVLDGFYPLEVGVVEGPA